MALDGLTIANIVYELNEKLLNSRLYKIAQPEPDELMLTIKSSDGQYRLTVSANASLPLIYLTDTNKVSPLTAPNFCMLLRKHLNNGRIISITQPGLERIIIFEIEHLNELGDLCRKKLIIELMGKHSNIIFTDDSDMILDSIKHISAQVSSVREVLPGRTYFIPNTQEKLNPLELTFEAFSGAIKSKPIQLKKALYSVLTGFSPVIALEICNICGIDGDIYVADLSGDMLMHIYRQLELVMERVRKCEFAPNIIYSGDEPVEFAPFRLSLYDNDPSVKVSDCATISEALSRFYADKNSFARIRQRGSDLRKIVTTLLERNYKKADLQEKQLKDSQKMDKYKLYGELIQAYSYAIVSGSKSYTAINYYTNEEVTIPLDEDLSVQANAVRYFERYNKLKRTFAAVSQQLEQTDEEIQHLESILNSLDIAETEDDLLAIRQEMCDFGYIRKKSGQGKFKKLSSEPMHYISSDGFHIYVGRNNYQNDQLTFKFANGGDWWFHAKKLPGSHVILKTEGRDVPDRAFEEAAALAAFYSRGREQGKVEVDYIERKHIKKPGSSKPGFVVYYTNYSLMAIPDIRKLQKLS